MIVNTVDLKISAVSPKQYPSDTRPEIAFVGRSNVGKSSLINALINRKSMARTSSEPGKTRIINFYNIEEKIYFVDLPGYGYAKVSKSEKEKWGNMIESYLKTREQLCAVVLLIDIRHDPTKDDIQMYEWLKYFKHNIIIACTKSDKISRLQVSKSLQNIAGKLGISRSYVSRIEKKALKKLRECFDQ
jgi:GTP-binding protein